MNISYRACEMGDRRVVADMILALYQEDPSLKLITRKSIDETFESFQEHPDRGTVMAIEHENEIIGYAILANFWSNEFGGNIVIIDELFVQKKYRGKGVATNFLKYLRDTKFGNSVALQLEVTPDNTRARKLYESLGFVAHKNIMLDLDLD